MVTVCDLIVSNRAHVYVCGDVTMASDVLRTLQKILQGHLNISQEDAQKYVLQMRVSYEFVNTLMTLQKEGLIK